MKKLNESIDDIAVVVADACSDAYLTEMSDYLESELDVVSCMPDDDDDFEKLTDDIENWLATSGVDSTEEVSVLKDLYLQSQEYNDFFTTRQEAWVEANQEGLDEGTF